MTETRIKKRTEIGENSIKIDHQRSDYIISEANKKLRGRQTWKRIAPSEDLIVYQSGFE